MSSKGNARKANRNTQTDDLLPSWDDVPSDDSLSEFIYEKTPAVNQVLLKGRQLFNSSSDSSPHDEDKPLHSTPLSGKERKTCPLRQRKLSATPCRVAVSGVLNFDSSPRPKTPSVAKKGLTQVVGKLHESTEQKHERFTAHANNRIAAFDKKADCDTKTTHLETPNTSNKSVAKTPTVTSRSIQNESVRRSGRTRKSAARRHNTTIIADWDSDFVDKIKDPTVPFDDTINLEKIEAFASNNSFKTESTPKETPSQTSNSFLGSGKNRRISTKKTEAIKRVRTLEVVSAESMETDSSSAEDEDVGCETGVLQLKAKEERKMETLVNQSVVYTLWKGRAMLVINDDEFVLEKGGVALVKAGDEHCIKNLEQRKKLVMRYCKVDR